jgi:hypothetical protein
MRENPPPNPNKSPQLSPTKLQPTIEKCRRVRITLAAVGSSSRKEGDAMATFEETTQKE